jgi:methylmalonyl-CoA mutase C-terminal domain/subunit
MPQLNSIGRVIIAKPGLDGHDRGAKFIARSLREHGFEVIYTGIRRTPEEIAATAVQEDVDAVGLSMHSGAHLELIPKVLEALRHIGADDIPVVCGGIIPEQDVQALIGMGVHAVHGPGTPVMTVVDTFSTVVADYRRRKTLL